MRASNELRRDLGALRRHLWFVALAFIVALAAAAVSLFIQPTSKDASFRARVSLSALPPLFGPETLPSMDDFARLATSPEALAKTSQALSAQDVSISAGELAGILSAQARSGQNAIDFHVEADDADLSLAIARAWSQAFAEIAPASKAELERQATQSYQSQLEQAQEELELKRQAITDLGVTTLPGQTAADSAAQVSALGATYEAKAGALALKEIERSDVQSTLDTLRAAVDSGTTLSTSQLRLLLAGILPADTDLGTSLTTQQAITALELRLTAMDGSLGSLRQEVQSLQSTLDQQSASLAQATSELSAAEENFQVASRLAQSYEVVGDQMTVLVTTAKEPQQEGRGVLDWLARFAAAAAFAAVVGVLGALALEHVSGNGSHQAATATPRMAPQPLTRNPPPPTRVNLAKSWPNVQRRRKRPGWERPLQFTSTAMAILLLLGVLGTFSHRQRARHRRDGCDTL